MLTKIDTYTYYDAVGNPLNNDAYAYTWEHGRQLAELAISSEFAIVTQPEDASCFATESAVFSVTAAGSGLSYQWQSKNGTAWENYTGTDAQTNTITVPATGNDGTAFRCVITNADGGLLISTAATLNHTTIQIASQSSDWWGTEEGTAIFTVEAISSDPNLTYQWKWDKNGVWTNSGAAGATTNTISVGASGDNGTTYRCYITDSNGNTVISEPVTIHTDPIGFITQPEDCYCSPTGTATFSVEVYGTDVTYQWQWHSPSSTTWQNSGATGANTNSISLGASGDNGTVYRCVITDANGNVAYSEPATVIPYAITWEFEYNADGMRTYRSNGVTSYEYIYNGSQLTRLTITDELDGSQSVMAFAYDAAGKPLSLNYNGTRYIYATNIQGDVIAILNASGTAVVTYTYDAWGTPLSISGSMADTLGADNPLRYRGYVWDSETNLYYLQSRYYDPEVGRFINADAFVATGQGLVGNNMFVYCGNNPVVHIDTTGTDYRLVGAGLQFEINVGSTSVGIEVICYWDTDECSNGGVVIAAYVYGGLSFDASDPLIASILATITDNSDLLISGSEVEILAVASLVGDTYSLSVSGVLIAGNEDFTTTESYEGSFTSIGGSIGKAKGSFAYSENCYAGALGVNVLGGSVSTAPNISKTVYVQFFELCIGSNVTTTACGIGKVGLSWNLSKRFSCVSVF